LQRSTTFVSLDTDLQKNVENVSDEHVHLRLLGQVRTSEGFATVNRNLILSLQHLKPSHLYTDIGDTSHYKMFDDLGASVEDLIVRSNYEYNKKVDILLHSKWPIDWDILHNCDKECFVLLLLAWEFTIIPNNWVVRILSSVSHRLAPSAFAQESFLYSGIPKLNISFLPHGVIV